jgi:hypothetical protein
MQAQYRVTYFDILPKSLFKAYSLPFFWLFLAATSLQFSP